MNKNKMLRLASVLLILTLLTTSIIGGTFAKYVTTDQGSDTARVAKFGVVATVSGDLFGSTYAGKTTGGNTIVTYSQNDGKVSAVEDVNGVASAKVVAPGTENKAGLTLSVSGTPEVSTQVMLGKAKNTSNVEYENSDIYLGAGEYGVMVEYTGAKTAENIGNYYGENGGIYSKATSATQTVYELCDIVDVATDYYPLTWYVGGSSVSNQAGIFSALGTKMGFTNGATVNPNELNTLSATTVGWEWKFQNGADGEKAGNDKKDTILGDMITAATVADSIAVVKKDTTSDDYDAVMYKNITSGASTIQVAYTGTEPTVLMDTNICACLTASFGASITVEQVD